MDSVEQHSDPVAKAASSVLAQKARAGQEVRQTQTMSLAKALRLTLAKVADDQLNMAMAVIGARVEGCSSDHLEALFKDAGLLMLLDGPQRRRGAAVFDADLVGGLIQQQTMGKVAAPLEGDPRPMTATDAAICAPFLDALLSRAAALAEDPAEVALIQGYAFGARVEDTRLLLMALEEPDYRIVHLTVDVAGGVRQGKIMLCMPLALTGRGPNGLSKPDGTNADAVIPAKLDKTVLALKVELHVALTSLTMPLSAVQAIAVDDVLDLGITAFDKACVQTKEGRKLGSGALGQINGTRALQLEHTSMQNVANPRRRAADRATLNLPHVHGDGTGTRKADRMSDVLEGRAEAFTAQTDQADIPALSELEGIPDMSDLPGFEEDDMLPQMGTG